MKALILCRGLSLELIEKISHIEFDEYILVNRWNEQLIDSKFHFLKDKNCYHFINREHINLLPKDVYEDFSIKNAYLNVLEEESKNSNIRKVLESYKIKVHPMCEDVSKWALNKKDAFPSSGTSALVNTTCLKKYNEIYIIGMDFFENDYYTFHTTKGGKDVKEYQKIKNKNMKNFVLDFCKNNKEANFKFLTYSNIESKDNIEKL